MSVLRQAKSLLGCKQATIFKEGRAVAEKGLVTPAWRAVHRRVEIINITLPQITDHHVAILFIECS